MNIYKPSGTYPLNENEIAHWANQVAGRKIFSMADFSQLPNRKSRLSGHHCNCGVNKNGYSKGNFELLPLTSPDVIEGEKAYMRCRKCGSYSHL